MTNIEPLTPQEELFDLFSTIVVHETASIRYQRAVERLFSNIPRWAGAYYNTNAIKLKERCPTLSIENCIQEALLSFYKDFCVGKIQKSVDFSPQNDTRQSKEVLFIEVMKIFNRRLKFKLIDEYRKLTYEVKDPKTGKKLINPKTGEFYARRPLQSINVPIDLNGENGEMIINTIRSPEPDPYEVLIQKEILEKMVREFNIPLPKNPKKLEIAIDNDSNSARQQRSTCINYCEECNCAAIAHRLIQGQKMSEIVREFMKVCGKEESEYRGFYQTVNDLWKKRCKPLLK
jgi:hypothetical protein